MNKEELIQYYEMLNAKEIEKLKSFKDGDFFKITFNNKIDMWGNFKNFKVTEHGVIVLTHLNYNYSHKGFETREDYFILQENSGTIEKIKSTELLVLMLRLREQKFIFNRRNKTIIDNSVK